MRIGFTLDANDPVLIVDFWRRLLHYELEVLDGYNEPDGVYWSIVDPGGRGPRLIIQRVPEPVTAKTRVHLDIHVPDIEATTAEAVALGATRVDAAPMEEVGAAWIRLTDPEGNLFCVIRQRHDT